MREVKTIAYVFGILLVVGALAALALGAMGGLWSLLGFAALGQLACATLLLARAASLRLIGAVAVVFSPVVCLCALYSVGVALLYLGPPWIIFVVCLAFIAVTAFCGWVMPWGWSKKRAPRGRSELPGRIREDQEETL